MLWDVCALPDYRRIAPAQHADLLLAIYADLVARSGYCPRRRLHGRAGPPGSGPHGRRHRCTLSMRESRRSGPGLMFRNRPGLACRSAHWQEITRDIEDRLSDALHERLTKRFVDRRTSVLMRRLRENAMLEAEISRPVMSLVEGHHVGDLAGFRFTPTGRRDGRGRKAMRSAAAQKALAQEFERGPSASPRGRIRPRARRPTARPLARRAGRDADPRATTS
jgi:ATP-dependent RNA helicase SUPV3L1/SUV3